MAAELKQIRIEHTVGRSLTTSAFELLPEELKNDNAVSWLREFCESREPEYDYLKDKGFEDYPELYLIVDILRKLVADNIKFYSAVLFHIGRRLKVAELADGKIAEAMQPDHLRGTFETNFTAFYELGQSEAVSILRETLSEAKRVHKQVASQNRSLWRIWKEEVDQFRTAFSYSSERLYRARSGYEPFYNRQPNYPAQALAGLMRDSFRNKELERQMKTAGFKVDVGDFETDPQIIAVLQWMSMDPRELEERRDLIRQENIQRGLDATELKRRREQEISAHIQKQLLDEFGDSDPFAGYEPLGKLPDTALHALYAKCTLPDGSLFYFAERWLKSLVEPFYYFRDKDVPGFKVTWSEEDIRNYARSADSAIRRHWVELARSLPTLPEQKMQVGFEEAWIERLVVAIRYEGKKRSENWTLASATQLIDNVVAYLNTVGYRLSAPGQERLEKLWNAAKETSYGIDW